MPTNGEVTNERRRFGREIGGENFVGAVRLIFAGVVEDGIQARSNFADDQRPTFEDTNRQFATRDEAFHHDFAVVSIRAVDGIRKSILIADHGQATTARLQRHEDGGLQAIGVLIFVDQDMIETAADIVSDAGIGNHLRPIEQEIVVIEHVLRLLGLDIACKELLELALPFEHPGKG